MAIFWNKDTKGFYDTTLNKNIPAGSVEISREQYKSLMVGESEGHQIASGEDGFPVVSAELSFENKAIVEKQWRNAELLLADIELYKVQDSDPKAKGSVSDWRSYRKALRAWPEHKDFPKKEHRPKAPDV